MRPHCIPTPVAKIGLDGGTTEEDAKRTSTALAPGAVEASMTLTNPTSALRPIGNDLTNAGRAVPRLTGTCWCPQEDLKPIGAPAVWAEPRNVGESWMRFANNARLPELSELDSPASSPAGERPPERVTLPADVQFWIELEVFLERIGQDQGADHDSDSPPLRSRPRAR